MAIVLNQISLTVGGYGLAPPRCRLEPRLPTVLLLEYGDALKGGGCAIVWIGPAVEKSLLTRISVRVN